jgi:hypothetical protein
MFFSYKYHYSEQANTKVKREQLTQNFVSHTQIYIYIYIYKQFQSLTQLCITNYSLKIIILTATCFESPYIAETFGQKNLEQFIMVNNT